MNKPRIVIVDDDDVCNMLSIRMLRKFVDAELIAFENPAEALRFLGKQTQQPDFILLDLLMPLMDGWEFLDRLKDDMGAFGIASKVIILTSSIRKADRQRALSFDCIKSYVNKPLEEKDIKIVFENCLVTQS